MRVDEEVLTLEPLSAVAVEPEHARQLFNDTDTDALWLVAGAPPEGARRRRLGVTVQLGRFQGFVSR
jgi:hypothetical protein